MYNKELNILYIINKSEINKMKVKITEDTFWVLANGQSPYVKKGFNKKQMEKLNNFLTNDVRGSEVLYVMEGTPKKMKITIQSMYETLDFWLMKQLSLAQ